MVPQRCSDHRVKSLHLFVCCNVSLCILCMADASATCPVWGVQPEVTYQIYPRPQCVADRGPPQRKGKLQKAEDVNI